MNVLTYPFFLFIVRKTAEQFQRSVPRGDPTSLGNASYLSIHQLKREVDSYKQRQQEIVSFNQVSTFQQSLIT